MKLWIFFVTFYVFLVLKTKKIPIEPIGTRVSKRSYEYSNLTINNKQQTK